MPAAPKPLTDADFAPAAKSLSDADFGPTSPAAQPPGSPLKSIAGHIAVTAAGMAPAIAGAEMGAGVGGVLGGPPGMVAGGLGGAAIGGLAIPAFEYAASRMVGLDASVPTGKEAIHAAYLNAVASALGPILGKGMDAAMRGGVTALESIFGIRPGLTAASEAGEAATLAGQELGVTQAGVQTDVAARQTRANMVADEQARMLGERKMATKLDIATRQSQADREAAMKGADLQRQQTAIRAEQAQARRMLGANAIAEHDKLVTDAERQVDTAKAKLREGIRRDIAAERPAVAERVAQKQTEKLVGKTQQEFQREAAQPYEQRAAALSKASDPFFDASAKFHEEVGAKFEPYVKKNDQVAPTTMDSIKGRLASVDATLKERGQRVESADLKRVIDDLTPQGDGLPAADILRQAGTIRPSGETTQLHLSSEQYRRLKTGEQPPEASVKTYGQLWGLRARANRVLASARNPADRWAAREVVNEINDAIPGVPPEIRSQYAFERKVNQSVIRKVAAARNPQEVGEALFGSKNAPEPAEVPLQIIRFTKQYNPQGMDGIREAFADRWLGNKMDANDLGKLNPQVLKELYGNNADSVIRLLGPEGNVKQASWNQLIASDPTARIMLKDAIRTSVEKQVNIAQRQAIVEGEAALRSLPSRYDAVKQAYSTAKTAEAKLKILAQGLPQPEQIQPTAAEAKTLASKALSPKVVIPTEPQQKTLAKQPPDIEAAQRRALVKAARPRFEEYVKRRLMFDAMFATLGGYGMLARNPGIGILAGMALGTREIARRAMGTEAGASIALKLLGLPVNRASIPAFGKALAALMSASIVHHINAQQPRTPPRP